MNIRECLERIVFPHGIRCLWFCPPWHRPGVAPTYDEYQAELLKIRTRSE